MWIGEEENWFLRGFYWFFLRVLVYIYVLNFNVVKFLEIVWVRGRECKVEVGYFKEINVFYGWCKVRLEVGVRGRMRR